MKSMNDNCNGDNNNWLGFSLSPHMKMEVPSDPHQYHHQQTQPPPASAAVPTSFFLSPHLNSSGICYGVGESGAFHSPLSVMPLKSDGSLCIMEALSRSQQEGPFLLSSMFLSLNLKTKLFILLFVLLFEQGWYQHHLQNWRTF